MDQASTKSAAVMIAIAAFFVLLLIWIAEENRKQAPRLEPCRETFTANGAVIASMGVIAATTIAAHGMSRSGWAAGARRLASAVLRWTTELAQSVLSALIAAHLAR